VNNVIELGNPKKLPPLAEGDCCARSLRAAEISILTSRWIQSSAQDALRCGRVGATRLQRLQYFQAEHGGNSHRLLGST
jgi:hypothetical protein